MTGVAAFMYCPNPAYVCFFEHSTKDEVPKLFLIGVLGLVCCSLLLRLVYLLPSIIISICPGGVDMHP